MRVDTRTAESSASWFRGTVLIRPAVKREALIDSGVDINPSNKNWTPLMIAVLRTNIQLTDLLLKNGADIQKRNDKGQTPLHLAARWGKPEIVKHLIEKGAFLISSSTEESTISDR